MKSSTKTSLALLSVFIVLCSSVSWLASITAAPTPANDLYVTFEEEADLDHVCFYITMKNEQDSDDSFPSKFLLNRTSIDIAKAETKLWEEQEYEYEVTHCKTCEVEVKNCTINNETKEEKCEPHNASVTDCDECGNWSEERTGYRWEGKQLASTEKDTGKKELRNQFEEIQIKKGETKRYKLCYYFNEIPINPSTGMSGSYGYMYLDVKDKLHYDFENSSCWNTSCCDKKMPVYGWCPHCSSDTEMVLLASNRTDNMGAYINGSLEFFWGNFTVNSTWQIIGYVYYNNETDYALVDPTETYQLEMDVDEGNSTDYGNPWDKNTILVLHLNGTGGHDSSTYGYTASVGDSPASVDGIVGHANYFDGSNDDMNYGDTIDGDFYMTVMLWMKASGTDSGNAITKYASGKKRWYMEHGGSGTGVDFNDNVHGSYYPRITAETVDGTWHHLAFVLNNTNAYAYFDGVLTATDSEANFQGCTNNNNLIVAGSNINYFNGTLDEVRIYNRSLSADEIMMIYNNTVSTHNVTQFGAEETSAAINPPYITNPANGTTTNDNTPTITFKVNGTYADYSCDLFFNSTSYDTNASVLNDTSITLTANASITDGFYHVRINCSNSTDYNISAALYLTIDTATPNITVTSPVNGTIYNESEIDINVSADETADTWWYELDGNGTNQTFIPNITLTGLLNGTHNITVCVNDSANNINCTMIYFTVNIVPIVPTVCDVMPILIFEENRILIAWRFEC